MNVALKDEKLLTQLKEISTIVVEAFRAKRKVIICGNGGSMADAMHFAEECTGRFSKDRDPLPVISISDPTHMSCTANDYGFERIFERGVRAFGQKGDLLILLSTSGNSRNLSFAAEAASELGMMTVAFLAKDGGDLLPQCDYSLIFPGQTSDRIQELHMCCLHALVETIEGELF